MINFRWDFWIQNMQFNSGIVLYIKSRLASEFRNPESGWPNDVKYLTGSNIVKDGKNLLWPIFDPDSYKANPKSGPASANVSMLFLSLESGWYDVSLLNFSYSSKSGPIIRPRSLVFANFDSNLEDEDVHSDSRRSMKKYQSATILRQHSVSPQKVNPSMYRTNKPALTSKISPSKVREKIRKATLTKDLERGSRSLPRKVGRESKLKHRDGEFEDYEENLESMSWSESDWC